MSPLQKFLLNENFKSDGTGFRINAAAELLKKYEKYLKTLTGEDANENIKFSDFVVQALEKSGNFYGWLFNDERTRFGIHLIPDDRALLRDFWLEIGSLEQRINYIARSTESRIEGVVNRLYDQYTADWIDSDFAVWVRLKTDVTNRDFWYHFFTFGAHEDSPLGGMITSRHERKPFIDAFWKAVMKKQNESSTE